MFQSRGQWSDFKSSWTSGIQGRLGEREGGLTIAMSVMIAIFSQHIAKQSEYCKLKEWLHACRQAVETMIVRDLKQRVNRQDALKTKK